MIRHYNLKGNFCLTVENICMHEVTFSDVLNQTAGSVENAIHLAQVDMFLNLYFSMSFTIVSIHCSIELHRIFTSSFLNKLMTINDN